MESSKVFELPELIKELYAITSRLQDLFSGRPFTPDGHLVGSIGEVLAAHYYGLELFPPSQESHDAIAPNGTLVQIKATQIKRVALRSEPQHLIVLKILPDGTAAEIYNGPGDLVWAKVSRLQGNGQRSISEAKLKKLMGTVAPHLRLPSVVE